MVPADPACLAVRRPRDARVGRPPAINEFMVCVDEWTLKYPAEQFDWRARSCYYKQQWKQCDKFVTVCAKSCKAAHCGADLDAVPKSILRQHVPPAPPRSSWHRRPPVLPPSPMPPPIPLPSEPAIPPAIQCELQHAYHVLRINPDAASFTAKVELTPWIVGRVVRLIFSTELAHRPSAVESAQLVSMHRSGGGEAYDFELLHLGSSSGHFAFTASASGSSVAFPDAITCDYAGAPRLPPPPRRPPRLRRPRPSPPMPPPSPLPPPIPATPPSPLPPSFSPPPSSSPMAPPLMIANSFPPPFRLAAKHVVPPVLAPVPIPISVVPPSRATFVVDAQRFAPPPGKATTIVMPPAAPFMRAEAHPSHGILFNLFLMACCAAGVMWLRASSRRRRADGQQTVCTSEHEEVGRLLLDAEGAVESRPAPPPSEVGASWPGPHEIASSCPNEDDQVL